MKFGKRLRLLAKSEWFEEYIDYKLLKQIIKGDGEGSPLLSCGDAEDPDACTREGSEQLEPAAHRARFIRETRAQLKRASKFMLAQVAILTTRIEDLASTVDRADTAKEAAKTIAAELDLEPSAINAPPPALPPAAPMEGGEGGTAAAAPGSPPSTAAGGGKTGGGGGSPSQIARRRAIKSVRNMIQQVADEVEDLKEFGALNTMAVSKAAKKWDKHRTTPAAAAAGVTPSADGAVQSGDLAAIEGDVTAPLRGALEALAAASALSKTGPLATAEQACHTIMTAAGALARAQSGAVAPNAGGGATPPIAPSAAARGRAARKQTADAAAAGATVAGVVPGIPVVQRLDIASCPVGVTKLRVSLGCDPLSQPMLVPVVVIRGATPGPVLGITSALHGNELNGIPVIHRIMACLNPATMVGTLVAVPVANPGGFVRHQREFSDGVDLNRIMPGKKNGNSAQAFAHKLLHRVIGVMEYLLDLHTASFGRVNSLYVRADMNEPLVRRLATLQQPQIIVHNTGPDGSLRAAAADMGIHAVTVEIGNPQRFHASFVDRAVGGVLRTLAYLNIAAEGDILTATPRHAVGLGGGGAAKTPGPTPAAAAAELAAASAADPVVCSRSFWIFTRAGGVLVVLPPVNTWVHKGQVIAEVRSIFGELVDRHVAPMDGVVVGKSENPVCRSGDRVLHLGVQDSTSFPGTVDDGH